MKDYVTFNQRLFLLVICLATGVGALLMAQSPAPAKPKQFIYVLHLVPRLYADANWTVEDKAALSRHLTRFQEAIKSGQLILAGRTTETGDKTFGIAIFEAPDEAAAGAFMKADPAVEAGLMTAELHPFRVVLEHKSP